MKTMYIIILHTVGLLYFYLKRSLASAADIFVEILFPKNPTDPPRHGRESSHSLSAFYAEGALLSVRDTAESEAQSLF